VLVSRSKEVSATEVINADLSTLPAEEEEVETLEDIVLAMMDTLPAVVVHMAELEAEVDSVVTALVASATLSNAESAIAETPADSATLLTVEQEELLVVETAVMAESAELLVLATPSNAESASAVIHADSVTLLMLVLAVSAELVEVVALAMRSNAVNAPVEILAASPTRWKELPVTTKLDPLFRKSRSPLGSAFVNLPWLAFDFCLDRRIGD